VCASSVRVQPAFAEPASHCNVGGMCLDPAASLGSVHTCAQCDVCVMLTVPVCMTAQGMRRGSCSQQSRHWFTATLQCCIQHDTMACTLLSPDVQHLFQTVQLHAQVWLVCLLKGCCLFSTGTAASCHVSTVLLHPMPYNTHLCNHLYMLHVRRTAWHSSTDYSPET
jgi:hypothetical protein